MPRTLSTARRNSLEKPYSDDLDLILITVTHESMIVPIHICNDVVNFVYGGEIYFGTSAEVVLISDTERPPQAKVRIANPDGKVGKFLQQLDVTPRLKLEVFSANDWSPDLTDTGEVDDNGEAILARYPTGTPTVDYSADWLRLTGAEGDVIACDATIGSFDLSSEPARAVRSTESRLPGLYR